MCCEMASVILAGGEGKRLFPLTLNHCKPAVFFGGVYRLIDIPISNSLNSGIKTTFIIAQYLCAELQHHLATTYRFSNIERGFLDFLTPEERIQGEKVRFLGTADAVRKNLQTLFQSSAEYFLILSGDQLYNINFQKMLQFAQEKNADLTVASIPVHEEEASRFGLLSVDQDFRISDFIEKPKDPHSLEKFCLNTSSLPKNAPEKGSPKKYLASMGIYIFKRHILEALLQEDSREDFGKHLIPTQIKKGKSFAFIYNGYWEDIGTIASFYTANLALTNNTLGLNTYDETHPIYSVPVHLPGPRIHNTNIYNSIICDGSLVLAKEISESVIGLRSYIGENTVIKKSILSANLYYERPKNALHLPKQFGIGANCLIENAIIDEHVLIGNNVQLTNRKKLQTYDAKGIYIRDGIIIIPANTEIPDNFCI